MAVLSESDIERNEKIEYMKRKTIERLLGPDSPYPIPDPVAVRFTAKSDGKSWYDEPRILENMNIDQQSSEYLAWYNAELHRTGGRIVTVEENKSAEEEILPIVK